MSSATQLPDDVPALEEVLQELEALSGQQIGAEYTVADLGIDSLVLAEWLFGLQERLGVVIEDDERIEEMLDLPISEIHRQLIVEAGLG